jgi:recombination protein U
MLNINKGMFLEEVINRTADYLITNNLGVIEKREIPIKIIKKLSENTCVGKITAKSRLDYFCIAKNKYFEFDAKETSEDYFSTTLIKNHQLE